ncbi:(2Fe-2S)-binding protein [Novosphingobium beihaiensis]|uniref:(2Fe-2S)-binding protein n=1 Tax=Novosphingobium beihaiensis TaxID=2930389 RepID=UPI002E10A7F4
MQLRINGESREVDADGDTPLLWVIRDDLGMTGTKYGCGLAQCGACSVMVDGVITRSCVTPVESVADSAITTIEAIEQDAVGKRVVEAWVKHQVPQCGYCQSGQVMAATALLKENASPSAEDVHAAMVNLCRCGTYNAIEAAMMDLAGIENTAPESEAAGGGEGGLGAGTIAAGVAVAAGAAVAGGALVRRSRKAKAAGQETSPEARPETRNEEEGA